MPPASIATRKPQEPSKEAWSCCGLGRGSELAWANVLSVEIGAQELGPEVEALLLDSLETLKQSERRHLAGYEYLLLGSMANYLKDQPRAIRFTQEGLAFHQARGDRWGSPLPNSALASSPR